MKFAAGIVLILLAFTLIIKFAGGAQIAPIIWVAFAYIGYVVTTAKIEAWFYDMRNTLKLETKNSHIWLTVNRAAFFIPVFLICGWMPTLGFLLLFPLLHDGSYFAFRHDLDVNIYLEGFWSEPPDAQHKSSLFDLSLVWRIITACAGVTVVIAKALLGNIFGL